MLTVGDTAQLKAAVLGLQDLDKTLRADINRSTTQLLTPLWRKALDTNAKTKGDRFAALKFMQGVGMRTHE